MYTLLIFIVVISLCFLGLGVKIFFTKKGEFPETEVGHNKEMRKRGITCARQDEILKWKKERGISADEPVSCEICGLSNNCEIQETASKPPK